MESIVLAHKTPVFLIQLDRISVGLLKHSVPLPYLSHSQAIAASLRYSLWNISLYRTKLFASLDFVPVTGLGHCCQMPDYRSGQSILRVLARVDNQSSPFQKHRYTVESLYMLILQTTDMRMTRTEPSGKAQLQNWRSRLSTHCMRIILSNRTASISFSFFRGHNRSVSTTFLNKVFSTSTACRTWCSSYPEQKYFSRTKQSKTP